eukprot:sb/3476330/
MCGSGPRMTWAGRRGEGLVLASAGKQGPDPRRDGWPGGMRVPEPLIQRGCQELLLLWFPDQSGGADKFARDYKGKYPSHYLPARCSERIRDLIAPPIVATHKPRYVVCTYCTYYTVCT